MPVGGGAGSAANWRLAAGDCRCVRLHPAVQRAGLPPLTHVLGRLLRLAEQLGSSSESESDGGDSGDEVLLSDEEVEEDRNQQAKLGCCKCRWCRGGCTACQC
jgi:hypothetical protein